MPTHNELTTKVSLMCAGPVLCSAELFLWLCFLISYCNYFEGVAVWVQIRGLRKKSCFERCKEIFEPSVRSAVRKGELNNDEQAKNYFDHRLVLDKVA